MRKKCFIHFGLHKTATTSFQQCCYDNRNYLRKLGINYYSFFCKPKNQFNIINHSIPIYTIFAKKPEYYHVNINWNLGDTLQKVKFSYQKQLDNLMKSENLLLSGEDLSLFDTDELSNFVNYLDDNDFEVLPFALFRNPYSFLCSSLQETIRNGTYIPFISFKFESTFPEIEILKYINYLTQSKRIQNLKTFFGDQILFYRFEDTFKNIYGPVGFILENFLKLDPSKFNYTLTNTGKNNLYIRLQNFLNKSQPKFIGAKNNKNFYLIQKQLNYGKKFLLAEREYTLIKDYLEEDTKYLKENMGDLFKKEDIDFSEDFSLDDIIRLMMES